MNEQDLHRGVAVVIDEEVNDAEEGDVISVIVKKIESRNIPLCKYERLKDARLCLQNLNTISFLVLDWKLIKSQENVVIPDALLRQNERSNVEFLKHFKTLCFAPVFIFTNEPVEEIERILVKEGLMRGDPKLDFIHIRQKRDLTKGDSLFDAINTWINANPTIYTIKAWERGFFKARNDVFWFLFEKSPVWPKIILKSFRDDMIDESSNMNEVFHNLIRSRIPVNKLDVSAIEAFTGEVNKDEIKDVIRGTMYLEKENIPDDVRPGDVYKEGGKFLLNIQPECDTVQGRTDGEVYVLVGSRLSSGQIKSKYNSGLGIIIEQNNEVILFGMEGNDFVNFPLKSIRIMKVDEELKKRRFCRLLHPYINHVQQRFSAYVGRFGLPRLPKDVLERIVHGSQQPEA